MTDQYGVMFNILTSLLPQLFMSIILPMVLVGIMARFMRNPTK